MDPEYAKLLFQNGKISEDTYNSVVAAASPAMSSQAPEIPGPQIGPPAPAAPVDLAALQAQFSQPQKPIDIRPTTIPPAAPEEAQGVATSRAPVPAAPRASQGPASEKSDRFTTPLNDEDTEGFKAWKEQNAPNDSGKDYDLQGAFKAGVVPDANGHMPDTFKKPNHPTFSTESQYAVGADRAKAGSWDSNGDFIPAKPLNAADTLLRSQKEGAKGAISIARERQESVIREHNAASQGYQQAADEQLAKASDYTEQAKQDESFKLAADTRAQKADDASRIRAKEIADMKIDTGRAWRNLGVGGSILMGIAAAFQGYNGQHGALDMMSKNVDVDVAAQQHDIQNKKDGWKMEENVAAREAARDNDWLAYRSTKRMEGLNVLKLKVQGIMDQSKSAQVVDQGKQTMLTIDQQIADTRMGLAKDTYMNMHGKEVAASQAAAAQVARHQRTQEDIRHDIKDLMKGTDHNAPMNFEDAYRIANAQNTGMDPGAKSGALPTITEREKADSKDGKTKDLNRAVAESNSQIDALEKQPFIDQMGFNTGLASKLGPLGSRLVNEKADTAARDATQANVQLQTNIAKFLKDTEGRIPQATIDALHEIKIEPGMSPQQTRDAINRYRSTINSVARIAGANAPDPHQGGPTLTKEQASQGFSGVK